MNTSNIQDTATGEQTRNTQHHEIRPADIVIGVIIGRTSEFFDLIRRKITFQPDVIWHPDSTLAIAAVGIS